MIKNNFIIKLILAILISFVTFEINAQSKFIGKYSGFPGVLELKKDSTYTYNWAYDLSSSWSVGFWYTNKDTLYLTNTPIYDTLYIPGSQSNDYKLVLSLNEFSEIIDSSIYELTIQSFRGQNRWYPPTKLYLKRRRLYFLINGKVDKGKAFDVIGQRYHKNSFKKM
jgi:hypothetical protein